MFTSIYLSTYLDIKVDTDIDIDRYTNIHNVCIVWGWPWHGSGTTSNHDEIKMVKIVFHKHQVCLFKHIDDFAFKPQYKIYRLGQLLYTLQNEILQCALAIQKTCVYSKIC